MEAVASVFSSVFTGGSERRDELLIGTRPLLSPSLISRAVSVDVKHHERRRTCQECYWFRTCFLSRPIVKTSQHLMTLATFLSTADTTDRA